VIAGERVRTETIRGVLTRLPIVSEQAVPHIAVEDRAYVAAEMNAFLLAWLSRLACPVLNRPTPTLLNGPSLSRERWLVLAGRAGLKLASRRHRAPQGDLLFAPVVVTVVGGRWFGDVAPELGEGAVRLARLAGTELLGVRFTSVESDGAFANAELLVDLTVDEPTDAILERLYSPGVVA
jgi:hypothetical protein